MQVKSSLLQVVGLVLIGQTMAKVQLHEDDSLVVHPEPTEELSQQQLFDKLNELKWRDNDRKGRISEYVADLLYRTKDKNSTRVLLDITVAELIGENNFRILSDCSQEAFEKRALAWERAPRFRHPGGVAFGVEVYLLRCLHLAAAYCLVHKQQVVSENINNGEWMTGLSWGNFLDGQGAGPNESFDEDKVYLGQESAMILFIERHAPAGGS